MTSATFDALAFFEKLKAAGVPEEQAQIQASAFRDFYLQTGQNQQLRSVRDDINEVRLEIEKVRAEMQKIKYDMLKWQFGIALALAAIMAKGFGWIGF